MAKSREHIVANGKPVFYAAIYEDLRRAAMECGWALGLHGSLANDMDIMAMPWTEDAKPVEEMIKALSGCFTDSPFADRHTVPHYDKPNGRVVYTMNIWAEFYLDINVIEHVKEIVEDPHEWSKVSCDLCGNSWVAVRPVGVEKLECPNCHNLSQFENI